MLLNDHQDFQNLEARLKIILPETYQESCDNVLPLLMGSAGLKYGADGKVAWNEIWGSFCHLAMAGGPPHKGKLLEPARMEEISAEPERYSEVVRKYAEGSVWSADSMRSHHPFRAGSECTAPVPS